MATLVWKLRVRWKRYTFATVASLLVARYTAKKFRENNVIRAYCNQAKRYGEERVASVERDGKPGKTKKIMVFLNPSANKRDAKIQFLKYSAPLFHLSGVNVTVVESQKEDHLRSLMNYVDPETDCIVIAGGDGTLMEVFTGLMRRSDAVSFVSIPVGIIPLGQENRFYQSNLSSTSFKSPARRIGDATMDIIKGEQTTPVHLMEIRPETGRLLYALSSLQWGPLRDAYENRDGFRLFGKLRLFISHLNVALRRWPTDYTLHVWHPKRHRHLDPDTGSNPPSNITATTSQPNPQSSGNLTASSSAHTTESLFEKSFIPVKAHCLRPRYGGEKEEKEEESGGSELTRLAGAELEHRELKVMGFRLSVQTEEGRKADKHHGVGLELNAWMDGSIHKADFIKQGWLETLNRSPSPLPSLSLSSPHFILQPHSHSETWVSIDGEVYETMPMSVTIIPSAFRAYKRTT